MAIDIGNLSSNIIPPQLAINWSEIWQAMPSSLTNGLNWTVKIGEILLVLVIIYFIILIITKLMKIRDSHNLSVIAAQVSEINQKLSFITDKKALKKIKDNKDSKDDKDKNKK